MYAPHARAGGEGIEAGGPVAREGHVGGGEPPRRLRCGRCGSEQLTQDEEGFFVCDHCATQSQDYVQQELDNFETYATGGRRALRLARVDDQEDLRSRKASAQERRAQEHRDDQAIAYAYPGAGGTYLDYFQDLLLRQADALISKCGMNPMLLDCIRRLWFRYLSIRPNQETNVKNYLARLNQQHSEKRSDDQIPVVSPQQADMNLEESRTWLEEQGFSSLLSPANSQEMWLNSQPNESNSINEEECQLSESKTDNTHNILENHLEEEEDRARPWKKLKRSYTLKSSTLEHARSWPHMSLTLALIYVACNILQEPFIALDFIRWTRTGVIPYEEVHTASNVKDATGNEIRPYSQLTTHKLEQQSWGLICSLNIEHEALPPYYPLLYRFLKELHLPPSLGLFVHHIFNEIACNENNEAKIVRWIYQRDSVTLSQRRATYTLRIMASIVVALKLVYGEGKEGEPASPLQQYCSFLKQFELSMPNGGAKAHSPANLINLPWYQMPKPPSGSFMDEMPPFREWRHQMQKSIFSSLPRDQIPYYPSDFWRMSSQNMDDYVSFAKLLYGPVPKEMVTLVQHLQSAHLNETKSNNEEAPYLTTKSSKDHVAEPRADLNPCNSIPTIEASRFTMYQGNISRIDQWNRTAFHPNYRFIIEAIAAYYEVRPFVLHATVSSLERVVGLHQEDTATSILGTQSLPRRKPGRPRKSLPPT